MIIYESNCVHACQLLAWHNLPCGGSCFPFPLWKGTKQWYTLAVSKLYGEWKELKSRFYLAFFPLTHVVSLRKEVLNFQQDEKESIGAAWAQFCMLTQAGLDLSLPNHVSLQHFCSDLDKESAMYLDISSRGSFTHKTMMEDTKLPYLILANTYFVHCKIV